MTVRPRRPRRPRKQDRLTAPDVTWPQNEVSHAIAPFDELSRQMDRKWGVDRLEALVSPELAARWGKALSGLNDAIASENPEEVIRHAGACIRGLKALDAEAEKLGAEKADPRIWEIEVGETLMGIIDDDRMWPAAMEARPDLTIVTMGEVAAALKAWKFDWIKDATKDFPGAQVIAIRPDDEELPI